MRLAISLAVLAFAGTLEAIAEPSSIDEIVAAGEGFLAAGDAPRAEATFERGTALGHSAELETSLVRAYMQTGQYRRALAFAAHAAGAHQEYPRAAALYAWLLHAGGQHAVAARTLESVPAVVAADEVLLRTRERLTQRWPVADAFLLEPPARLAPYATDVPRHAGVVASAVLSADGQRALTVATALQGATALWVRNGRGETVRVTLDQHLEVAGLALASLRLETPLRVPTEVMVAGRPPFAGSVMYAVEFAPTPDAEPAWPLLRLGFLGRATGADGVPSLGVDLPTGLRGGPVFDEAGRLVGLAASNDAGEDRLVAAASLPSGMLSFGDLSPAGPTRRVSLDLVYERSLLLTLQLITSQAPE